MTRCGLHPVRGPCRRRALTRCAIGSASGFALAMVLGLGPAEAANLEAKQVTSGLSVVTAGTGVPMPTSLRSAACNIVYVDGRPVGIIDAGPGCFARLGEIGSNLSELSFIGITHWHADHSADLSAIVSMVYMSNLVLRSARTEELLVFGPDGAGPFRATEDLVQLLFGRSNPMDHLLPNHGHNAGVYSYLDAPFVIGPNGRFDVVGMTLPGEVVDSCGVCDDDGALGCAPGSSADEAYDRIQEVTHPLLDEVPGLRIHYVPVRHGEVPAVAYRLEYGGQSVVFTGDNTSDRCVTIDDTTYAPSYDNMVALQSGATMVFSNTAINEGEGGRIPLVHTRPSGIGRIAREADPEALVLTHLRPPVYFANAAVKRVIQAGGNGYLGPVTVAFDRDVFNLPGNSALRPFKTHWQADHAAHCVGTPYEGMDYGGARAHLEIEALGSERWAVRIEVQDGLPATVHSVWAKIGREAFAREPGQPGSVSQGWPNPFTGAGVLPLMDLETTEDFEELVAITRPGRLTQKASDMAAALGVTIVGPGSTEAPNAFLTDEYGNATWEKTIDWNPEGNWIPVDRLGFGLEPLEAGGFPFALQVASHCANNYAEGLHPGSREGYFDWPY